VTFIFTYSMPLPFPPRLVVANSLSLKIFKRGEFGRALALRFQTVPPVRPWSSSVAGDAQNSGLVRIDAPLRKRLRPRTHGNAASVSVKMPLRSLPAACMPSTISASLASSASLHWRG